jgi:predicted permease
MQDVRYAWRMISKAPSTTVTAIVTLALGIGATSAIFSFVNAILLSPLPGIGDADRVVTIGRTIDGQGFDNSSYPNYVDLRDQNAVFSDVAAVTPTPFSLSTADRAERLTGAAVTPNYFRTLGVRFARGRGLLDTDHLRPGGPAVAVISYGIWERLFGLDAGVVGRAVSIDGYPFQIVGVTARGFLGTDATTPQDLWVPLSMVATMPILPSFIRGVEVFQMREGVWIMLYARLKQNISVERADANVQAIAHRLRAYPGNEKNGWTVAPGVGLHPDDRRRVTRLAGLLFGAVGVLFLLGCANVATLTLSRAAARAREISVRLALGASRARLTRQLLTESLVLALLGGSAGLLVSYWATAGLSALLAGSSRLSIAADLSPDLRVLGFTLFTSCVAAGLFGLAPALQSSRANLVPGLKEAATAAPRQTRLRRAFVVVQLTLSIVLLVAAGLLLRSVRAFSAIQPGFDASKLILLTVEPSITGRYDDARLRLFYDRLLEGVHSIAGVEAATLARIAPVTPRGYGMSARIPDKPGSPVEKHGLQFNTVASNYFDVMRIPILRGRALNSRDTTGSPAVAVVNETAAQRFWPDEDALGKLVWISGEPVPRQVVGVAAIVKYRELVERPYPVAYFPMSQPYPMSEAPAVIHVRTPLPAAKLAAEVGREVHRLDPDVPVFDVKTVSRHIADSYWQQRLIGAVIGILAALALTLGSAGMYGVMAYAAAERTHEIGVRLALGAPATGIVRLFTAQAARIIAIGVVLGVALALAVTRVMASLLFGVTSRDPFTFAAAVVLLASVSLLACLGPAVRATRVDPMIAVRAE